MLTWIIVAFLFGYLVCGLFYDFKNVVFKTPDGLVPWGARDLFIHGVLGVRYLTMALFCFSVFILGFRNLRLGRQFWTPILVWAIWFFAQVVVSLVAGNSAREILEAGSFYLAFPAGLALATFIGNQIVSTERLLDLVIRIGVILLVIKLLLAGSLRLSGTGLSRLGGGYEILLLVATSGRIVFTDRGISFTDKLVLALVSFIGIIGGKLVLAALVMASIAMFFLCFVGVPLYRNSTSHILGMVSSNRHVFLLGIVSIVTGIGLGFLWTTLPEPEGTFVMTSLSRFDQTAAHSDQMGVHSLRARKNEITQAFAANINEGLVSCLFGKGIARKVEILKDHGSGKIGEGNPHFTPAAIFLRGGLVGVFIWVVFQFLALFYTLRSSPNSKPEPVFFALSLISFLLSFTIFLPFGLFTGVAFGCRPAFRATV